MKNWVILGGAAVALAACDGPQNPDGNQTVGGIATAPATNVNTSAPGTSPRIQTGDEFVQVASASDRFEIESSRLALQKSQNPEVKRYAQTMVDEHNQSSNELKTVVRGLNPPLTPRGVFNAKQNAAMTTLQAQAAGPAFDRAYLLAQAEGHQATLAAMRDYGSGGEVTELKTFATSMAPMVQRHLSDAQRLLAGAAGG